MDIRRIIFLLFTIVLFSLKCFSENYDNASLLNTLVEKGILTQTEANEIKKSNAEQQVCIPESVKSFRTFFIVQTRFSHTHQIGRAHV